jgi:predicted TIM-barrel fold metal-dependent hydrolase
MMPIFDSMAHPTVTGKWLDGAASAAIDQLIAAMKAAGFSRACAVGLAGVEGYTHHAFADLCRPFPELVPIAGIDPRHERLHEELDTIAALGFRGIKAHPRLSKFGVGDACFRQLLALARDRDLPVFVCTYFHTPIHTYPLRDPLYDLAGALRDVPDCRVVLVHGGDVNVLKYVQLARHSPNILIDLSHTMMKYRGSSLDLDLAYLFRNFNRRICVGSDYPEYDHHAVRQRFEELSAGLDEAIREQVAYRNLDAFLTAGSAVAS